MELVECPIPPFERRSLTIFMVNSRCYRVWFRIVLDVVPLCIFERHFYSLNFSNEEEPSLVSIVIAYFYRTCRGPHPPSLLFCCERYFSRKFLSGQYYFRHHLRSPTNGPHDIAHPLMFWNDDIQEDPLPSPNPIISVMNAATLFLSIPPILLTVPQLPAPGSIRRQTQNLPMMSKGLVYLLVVLLSLLLGGSASAVISDVLIVLALVGSYIVPCKFTPLIETQSSNTPKDSVSDSQPLFLYSSHPHHRPSLQKTPLDRPPPGSLKWQRQRNASTSIAYGRSSGRAIAEERKDVAEETPRAKTGVRCAGLGGGAARGWRWRGVGRRTIARALVALRLLDGAMSSVFS